MNWACLLCKGRFACSKEIIRDSKRPDWPDTNIDLLIVNILRLKNKPCSKLPNMSTDRKGKKESVIHPLPLPN